MVLWRLAARLVTGPAAFLVAFVIDLSMFALQSARSRMAVDRQRASG